MPRAFEVFLRFLRLGVTAFGGPIAHLGYFRREFVERAAWIDDESFAEIVALCSALPGPTSSQVGMLVGANRAGVFGALAAWLGFTLPSAMLLAVAGWLVRSTVRHAFDGDALRIVRYHPWLTNALGGAAEGLIVTAYAVILLAVVSLSRSIVRTPFARVFACVAFCVSLAFLWTAPSFTWIALLLGAVAGALYAPPSIVRATVVPLRVSRRVGIGSLVVLGGTLVALRALPSGGYGGLFATTFRAGSLVFGGGHVVLGFLTPLVGNGGVSLGQFQAGYGLTQAMPGPLFAFASYLGAADASTPDSFAGALVAVGGIFLPSFLILPAALALWTVFRETTRANAVLTGLNVAVVGLLAATFVDLAISPFEHAVVPFPFAGITIGIIAFVLLTIARWPAWAVVVATSCGSAAYALASTALHVPNAFRLG